MPYEAARTAELIGRCLLSLGDRSSAALEFAAALETFESLGATPDVARVQPVVGDPSDSTGGAPRAGVLSARELEVLTEVAKGRTNREVADALSISQHTVGRHLENIFAKLAVNTRAAAIAHAYEHDLL
jgi:DNA-binding CsgD family transcriptional regulator